VKRRHLFEWEDQPWLPTVLRDFITDHLRFHFASDDARPLHRAMAALLHDAMRKAGTREIVDLCSGGGGPLLAVQRCLRDELDFETTVTLTDLYPNIPAFELLEHSSPESIHGLREPVSAFDVPPTLRGIRTLFTAFHHFRPVDAKRILIDARVKRSAIAVFEPLERKLWMALAFGLGSVPTVMWRTPKLGPMSWSRFALTYLLPLAPAMATWDGVVSTFRSYTVDELAALASAAGSDAYAWEAGQTSYETPLGPFRLTYLIGVPI
jgi:hypothetical protein